MGASNLWISPCYQLSFEFCTEYDCKGECVALLQLLLGIVDLIYWESKLQQDMKLDIQMFLMTLTKMPLHARVPLFIYSAISPNLYPVKSLLGLYFLKVEYQRNWYLKMFNGSVTWIDTGSFGTGLKLPCHDVET